MPSPDAYPPGSVAERFNGNCCADDPWCEHSFLDDQALAAHMAAPWQPEPEVDLSVGYGPLRLGNYKPPPGEVRYQALDASGVPSGPIHVIGATPEERWAWHTAQLDALMAARDARVRRARSVYEQQEAEAQAEFNEAVNRENDRYLAERLAAGA